MITHNYSHYANKTVNGIPGDLEEDFLINLGNENRKKLEYSGLVNNPVIYTFNKDGFRADQFDEQNQILFLGCSYTMGMGVPYHDCWTTIVSKKLQLKNHNLGIAGSSHDTAFRLFYHYHLKLKPKIVVFLTTEITRLELVLDKTPISLGVGWQREDIIKGNFYKHWLLNEENSELNYQKNCLAIENLCLKNNIKYYQFSINDNFPYPLIDVSRDLHHPGITSHLNFSKRVLEAIC